MVIYLEQFAAAKAASAEWMKNGTYADEVMYASWNPAILQMAHETGHAAPSPKLPDDLSTVDEELHDRIRALATLI